MSGTLKVILPLLVLLVGGGATAGLVITKDKPEKKEAEALAMPVEVAKVSAGPDRVKVRAKGTVVASQRVNLSPEVSGRIVWMNDKLVPGGRLEKGDELIRIDPRDYQAAIAQQNAQIASQQLILEQEKGRGVVAQREWDILHNGDEERPDGGSPLALREPQRKSAEVGLQAAESALTQARVNLSRTTMSAPFNAIVQSESVESGQLVTPQFNMAVLIGTDSFWVQVSVPVANLMWFELPRDVGHPGASAEVWAKVGNADVRRPGKVVRLLPDLDPVGNMARVLVEIEDPYGLKGSTEPSDPANEDPKKPRSPALPLLLGSFVDVEIQGNTLAGVVQIPRASLQENNEVFAVVDNKLVKKSVEILWRAEDALFVTGDLKLGDAVVISPISAPVDGMALRILDAEDKTARAKPSPEDKASDANGGASK